MQKCEGTSRFPGEWGAGRQTGRGTRQGSRALTDRRRQVRRQVRGTRVQTAGGARPCRAPSRSLPQDPREHPRGPSAVLGSGGEAGNHTAPPGVTVSCHKHVSGTCSQTLPEAGLRGRPGCRSRASTLSEGHRQRAPGWGGPCLLAFWATPACRGSGVWPRGRARSPAPGASSVAAPDLSPSLRTPCSHPACLGRRPLSETLSHVCGVTFAMSEDTFVGLRIRNWTFWGSFCLAHRSLNFVSLNSPQSNEPL